MPKTNDTLTIKHVQAAIDALAANEVPIDAISWEEDLACELAELGLTEGWETRGALALFEYGVPFDEACTFFEVTETEVNDARARDGMRKLRAANASA